MLPEEVGTQAAEALIKCRRTLKNSYAFAFFMSEGVELTLMEHLQADLNSSTESLSQMLEQETGHDRVRATGGCLRIGCMGRGQTRG